MRDSISTNCMTTLQTLTFLLTFAFFSCNGNSESSVTKNENVLSDTQVSVSDTIKKFSVDDYPITNKMFTDKSNNSSYRKLSGNTFSVDKIWFSNDTIKQTLVFELYSDYHRLVTYHFLNNDTPIDLINKIELHTNDGKLASDKQKLKDFSGFLKQATKINSSYFVTNKGLKLGDIKQKAVDIYGSPNKKSITDEIEKLEWLFLGDEFYDGKTNLKGKPLAENSFGHQIEMYFRNGKLIGQILFNDIP